MGRQKHTKTDFEKNRTKYRELCDRHVVTFEVDMDETMKRHPRMPINCVSLEMNVSPFSIAVSTNYSEQKHTVNFRKIMAGMPNI